MFVFPKGTLVVLLGRSAPLSQLVLNNEEGFRYSAGNITCNVTGMAWSGLVWF